MPVCPRCGRDNPEEFRLCGHCGAPLAPADAAEVRKTVTVVFSDLVGSTALGERVDPESVRRILARYFAEVRSVLERHGGTVEKFIGDAVMAVFGIPELHEDDAVRAVRAADEARAALDRLNEELERDWGVRLASRTGVNTGEVVAGEPGTGQTLVTGDAVNVAARLEQAAGPGEILMGEEAFRLVRDAVVTERVPPLELKGKAEPVRARRLLRVFPHAAGVARRLDSPMVGRDRELRVLIESFERAARDGACRLVTVLGSAGVGKSRLSHELIASLGNRATLLRGRCLPYGEGITFWPVREIVRQAAAIGDAAGPDEVVAAVERLLPADEPGESALIAQRVASAIGGAEAAGAIQETFWGVRRFLEALAVERPLLVVLDDIHWAQPTLLDLIEYVAGFSRVPLLLVCLARPDLLDVRPGWGSPGPNAELVSLEPLTGDQEQALIDNLLGRAELPAQVRDRIVQAAEGNPLFVEEMLRMLIDDGLLLRDDGRWVPVGDLLTLAAPPTIQALLATRLDRLEDEERALLQRASVVGKVFWWGAVSALAPEPQRAMVGSGLQSLVRKELIQPDPSSFRGDDAFRFRHILIRDAAYESAPKRLRADLHERFAAWLEERVGGGTDEYAAILGYHLEQAYLLRAELGPPDLHAGNLGRRAAGWLAASGRAASARGDATAAVNLLGRATRLLPEDDTDRRRLLVDLAEALSESGDLARAAELLEEARRLARAAGDDRVEWLARIGLADLRMMREPEGATEEALQEAEAAIRACEASADDVVLARAWLLTGTGLWIRGQAGGRDRALVQALEHARRAGDTAAEMEAVSDMGGPIALGPVPVPEAIERVAEMRGRYPDNMAVQLLADHVLGHLRARLGEFDEARKLVTRWRDLMRELGQERRWANTANCEWDVLALAGDWAEGERGLRQGFEVLDRMLERSHLSTVASNLAEALYRQGRLDEAERYTAIGEETGASDDFITQVAWRRTRAGILAVRGEAAEAERLALEAVEVAARTDFLDMHGDALLTLADVLQGSGRRDEAVAAARDALALYERRGNVVSAARARAMLPTPD
jgi:class 3 adenylate cyclase/tetratricopeptide (TPR) repeat protein